MTLDFSPRRLGIIRLGSLKQAEHLADTHNLGVDKVLLACWLTVLSRHVQAEDVVEMVISTAFDGRGNEELTTAIGPLCKYLPISLSLENNLEFHDLLTRVGELTEEAGEWQECFMRGDMDHPLFAFSFENRPPQVVKPAFRIGIWRNESVSDRFGFKLNAHICDGQFVISFDYDAGFYDRDDLYPIIARFETLYHQIMEHPRQPIGVYDLLPKSEKKRLLTGCNQGASEIVESPCIIETIEAQVSRTPQALALLFQDQRLTYTELDRRVNLLAGYLQDKGIGAECFVTVCTKRVPEMIIGMLAVFKAGGIYVPMDPDDPKERLAYQMDQVRSRLILTNSFHLENLSVEDTEVFCFDREWQGLPKKHDTVVHPEQAAYLIFTSGSSGKPKGVLSTHGNLAHQCQAVTEHHGLTETDRFLQFSSFNFDASLEQILPTLCRGAGIVLRDDTLWDADELHQNIASLGITIINLPTAYWHQVAQTWAEDSRGAPGKLRLVIVGGEAMLPEYLTLWRRAGMSDVPLINAYGPTETTITATTYRVGATPRSGKSVPVGLPLGHRRAYILDTHGELLPVGFGGELCLAGAGLARGYHRSPTRTALAFVPNPNGGEGERLYKTGDQARLSATGTLCFVGRIDHQIKLRGFRIELGEIEFHLTEHEAVQETRVLVRDSRGAVNEKMLVAYYVPVVGKETSAKVLREFLRTNLPDYMLPTFFEPLEVMPLTANGKVDVAALPEPGESLAHSVKAKPRNAIEASLSDIWKGLLGYEDLSIRDDFFDLGGHSLLATQAVSRIRNIFQTEILLQEVFAHPTIESMAKRIEDLRGVSQETPQLVARPSQASKPLSFAQERLWFLQRLDPDSAAYNAGIFLRFEGILIRECLREALQVICDRHEPLRTVYPSEEGRPVQHILPSFKVSLNYVDLNAESGEETDENALIETLVAEAGRPYDLQNGPVVRTSLYRTGPREHVLALNMHHITSDGWSLGILLRELSEYYSAFSQDLPISRTEIGIQYTDFAAWQRHLFDKGYMKGHLDYWKTQLGDEPLRLELPADKPRPAIPRYQGQSYDFRISQEQTQDLKDLAAAENVSLFMLLLAGYQVLLSRLSGLDDIAVGSPSAGRGRLEIEDLISFFVNTLVIRADLSGTPDFRKFLAQVRTKALNAYDHQNLPFEKLVEELNPSRDLSRNPLFQAEFTLQNGNDKPLQLPNLTVSMVAIENRTSQFDLSLDMTELSDGLFGRLQYDSDLFELSTIERWAGSYLSLLEHILSNPSESCKRLNILHPDERERLLETWNDTGTDIPYNRKFHDLFEEQVARTPDRTAVACEARQITYATLSRLSDQGARRLRREGIGPERVVAYLAPRSSDFLVGILSIIKAGGIYLPIDPSSPPNRIEQILHESKAALVLHGPGLAPLAQHSDRCLSLAALLRQEAPTSEPAGPLTAAAGQGPESCAYIIFTSGSTGRPKGAMVCHKGLLNHQYTKLIGLKLHEDDVISQNAPQSFDISVWQFLSALLVGARVRIFSQEVARNPEELSAQATASGVTLLEIVPVLLRAILDLQENRGVPQLPLSLRFLMLTGEALPPDVTRRCLKLVPNVPLINAYGPAECADDVTQEIITTPPAEHETRSPIGRTLINMRMYVLDANLSPVPIGVSGMGYVAGVGVGRGYLHRPARTAEVFIPDPFSKEPGERLYNSGDLLRYLGDGRLEFVGRDDFQVKIRGYRIEPGDIEAALSEWEEVANCVVVAQNLETKRLVAYIVTSPGRDLLADDQP